MKEGLHTMKTAKRLLALNLALVLLLTILPTTALAAIVATFPGGSEDQTFTPTSDGFYEFHITSGADNTSSGCLSLYQGETTIIPDLYGSSVVISNDIPSSFYAILGGSYWTGFTAVAYLKANTGYTVNGRHTGYQISVSNAALQIGKQGTNEYRYDKEKGYALLAFKPTQSGWYTIDKMIRNEDGRISMRGSYISPDGNQDAFLNSGMAYLTAGNQYYINYTTSSAWEWTKDTFQARIDTPDFDRVEVDTPYSLPNNGSGDVEDHWLSFTPSVSGKYTFTAASTNYDGKGRGITFLKVYGESIKPIAEESTYTEDGWSALESISTSCSLIGGKTYYLNTECQNSMGGVCSATVTAKLDRQAGPVANITSRYPANGDTQVNSEDISEDVKFKISFDRAIANTNWKADIDLSTDVAFSVYKSSTDELIYRPSQYSGGDFKVSYPDAMTLEISPINYSVFMEPETEYYITMGKGFVKFQDGSVNPEIRKGDWTFKTKKGTPTLTGTDFQMGVDSFSFNNQGSYFGDWKYYLGSEYRNILYSKLSLKEKALIQGMRIADTLKRDFGGECFGMSAVMGQMYIKNLPVSLWGGRKTFDLNYPRNDSRIGSLIYYYHLLQALPEFADDATNRSQYEMGKEVIDTLIEEKAPVVVNIKMSDVLHSVLAYAVDRSSDFSHYIVYVADPNALTRGNNEAAAPTKLCITKDSYQLSSMIMGTSGHEWNNVSFYSVIADSSCFERFNPSESIKSKQAPACSQYSILKTTADSFRVEANGKFASVKNGVVEDGATLFMQNTYNLSGDADIVEFSFCVEGADDYKVIFDSNLGMQTTALAFDGSRDIYQSANTDAKAVTFNVNGTVSVEESSGNSELTTTAASVYDTWDFVSASSTAPCFALGLEDENCKIESEDKLGTVHVVGRNDWTSAELDATIPGSSAYVQESKEISQPAILTLSDADGVVLDSCATTFTAVYMTQGGSLVEAETGIHYGDKLTIPQKPVLQGYIFEDWYMEPECITVWNFDNPVTENITLYAKWSQKASGESSGGSSGGSSDGGSTIKKLSASVGGDGKGGTVESDKEGNVIITPDEGYEVVKVTVNGKEVEIPADGKLAGLKTTDKVVVTFEKISASVPAPIPVSERFTDVKPGVWYEDAVQYVVDNELFNGTSENTFNPGGTMTRGMLATVLYRLAGEPGSTHSASFHDVESGMWYTEAALWAAETEVVKGYANGNFAPGDPITREQLAVMLWRYAGSPTSSGSLDSFSDSWKTGSWAVDALEWAVEQGIVTGKGGGILDPQEQAARAEVATMLMRYIQTLEK